MTPDELRFRQSLKDKPNPVVRFDANMLREIGWTIAEEIKKATAPLKQRIEALETKMAHWKYCGVWSAGQYEPGNFVTHHGSLFTCLWSTQGEPGKIDAWQLCCKRGKDGKDGLDAGRRPTIERSYGSTTVERRP
jgi:hypothetical protein